MADYQEFFIKCDECGKVTKFACLEVSGDIECACMDCDYEKSFESWDDVMEHVVD